MLYYKDKVPNKTSEEVFNMSESRMNGQAGICPKCGSHCPVDALQCGKGRKYFGVEEREGEGRRDRDGGHDPAKGGLGRLLHRCGRFARHAALGEDELFQALTEEERAALRSALEKLASDWQGRYGEECLRRGGGKHCKHGDFGK